MITFFTLLNILLTKKVKQKTNWVLCFCTDNSFYDENEQSFLASETAFRKEVLSSRRAPKNRANFVEKKVGWKIVATIAKQKNLNLQHSFSLICILVQTNSSKQINADCTVLFHGAKLDGGEFLNAINLHAKDWTAFQFCRIMQNEIADLALFLKVEGNLANKMRMDHPTLASNDAVWCSSFQKWNTNCPVYIRKWMEKTYPS